MKKPRFLAKPIIFLIVAYIILFAVFLVYVSIIDQHTPFEVIRSWPEWKQQIWSYDRTHRTDIILLWGTALLMCFMISMWWLSSAYTKENKWYWENKRDEIKAIKLKAVGLNREPQWSDLDVPRDGKTRIRFSADYQGKIGWRNHEIQSDDPGLDFLIEKIENPKLLSDRHITKTKIIAVNNSTVTYTNGGISIGGALIGGILAGDVGALLGGLTGSKTSQTKNGENFFTFLVCYDDRSPETEKVKESTPRFKFLITKLET